MAPNSPPHSLSDEGTLFVRQVTRDGPSIQGPFPIERIRGWIVQGRVREHMSVSADGIVWTQIVDVPELRGATGTNAGRSTTSSPGRPPEPVPSDRMERSDAGDRVLGRGPTERSTFANLRKPLLVVGGLLAILVVVMVVLGLIYPGPIADCRHGGPLHGRPVAELIAKHGEPREIMKNQITFVDGSNEPYTTGDNYPVRADEYYYDGPFWKDGGIVFVHDGKVMHAVTNSQHDAWMRKRGFRK